MIADSPISVRKVFYVLTILYLGMLAAVAPIYLEILWTLVIGAPLILLGLRDVFQKSQTVPRNFPIIGHLRYLLEEIRPEIRQYFLEDETTGMPFARKKRSIVYQPGERAPRQWAEGISIEVNRALGQAELIAKRGEWVLTVKR